MKHFVFACTAFITLSSCATNNSIVNIPAKENIQIDNKGLDSYEATIKNNSFLDLEVAVIDSKTKEKTSGFGLGKKAKVEVMVREGNTLYISNPTGMSARVKIDHKIMDTDQIFNPKSSDEYVSFTLQNNTAKSIPLIIPTVMNPNLSPFSKSGVDLKYGQKVFFRAKGKRHVLLIVNDNIKDGDQIKVGKLLMQRKKDLGL